MPWLTLIDNVFDKRIGWDSIRNQNACFLGAYSKRGSWIQCYNVVSHCKHMLTKRCVWKYNMRPGILRWYVVVNVWTKTNAKMMPMHFCPESISRRICSAGLFFKCSASVQLLYFSSQCICHNLIAGIIYLKKLSYIHRQRWERRLSIFVPRWPRWYKRDRSSPVNSQSSSRKRNCYETSSHSILILEQVLVSLNCLKLNFVSIFF